MLNPKRIVSIVAVFALAIACVAAFAGCDGGSSEPQSAKDVISRYAASNPDNCNMKGDVNISAEVSGMNMSIPISFDLDVNGNSSHGTVSMSMFGVESKGEMYTVEQDGKFLTYSKADTSGSLFGTDSSSEGEWTVTETETAVVSEVTGKLEGLFENATFEKTDEGYLVSVSGADAFAYLQKLSAESEDAADAASAIDNVPQEYLDLINGLVFNFTFDKDCKLTAINIPETKSSVTVSGQTMDIAASCNVAFSNYGQVGEIVVPDEVVSAAQPAASFDLDEATSALDGDESASADAAEASEASESAEASKAA